MARYNSVTGPAIDSDATASPVLIPGMRVTRSWDNGELLILARVGIVNFAASTTIYTAQLNLDGVPLPPSPINITLISSAYGTLSLFTIASIQEGIHTLDLLISSLSPIAQVILARQSVLTVVQLPLWDQDTGIIIL